MRTLAAILALLTTAALAACLGSADRPGPASPSTSRDPMTPIATVTSRHDDPPDLGEAPDLTPRPDLAGLVDCWGKAVCDPTSMICIKYLTGHIGDPGPARAAPSCYAPNDGCPNGVFDCACIQADPTLSLYCQGTCVDNKNGTFTCYEKQPGQ
jgi:hypothetical protein